MSIQRVRLIFALVSLSFFTSTGLLSAAWQGEGDFIDFSEQDQRHLIVRFVNFLSLLPSEGYAAYTQRAHKDCSYPVHIEDPQGDTEGMFVMGHGRNAHPCQFWQYVRHIKSSEQFKQWSIFTPEILDGGSTYLNDFMMPVLAEILAWAQENPKLPIILIGTSNSGRLIDALSNKILNNPLLVISIAGAHGGSALLTLGIKCGLASCPPFSVQPAVQEELVENSPCIKQLINDTRARAQLKNIDYIFIGVSEDLLLLKRSLAFPMISDKQQNILFVDSGHGGIVNDSLELVFSRIDYWLKYKAIEPGQEVIKSWRGPIVSCCLLGILAYLVR